MKENQYSNMQLELNEFRGMRENELIYHLTNREEFSEELHSCEANYIEVIESLTPGRKKVALAAIELYKRRNEKELSTVTDSESIYKIMHPIIGTEQREEVWLLFLNNANRILRKTRVSVGSITASMIDFRIIGKEILKSGAVRMILTHNHPGGLITPSRQDDNITERIKELSRITDVTLLDHIIVADGQYYSYSDSGRI